MLGRSVTDWLIIFTPIGRCRVFTIRFPFVSLYLIIAARIYVHNTNWIRSDEDEQLDFSIFY